MRFSIVRARAMNPPVIEAVRVPPSAWSTSQSMNRVRFPRKRQIDDAPERPADQPLDLLGPPGLLAPRRLSGSARGGCARKHPVLRRHPSLVRLIQKRGHFVLDTASAEYSSITNRDENRAFGVLGITDLDADFSQSREHCGHLL